MHETHASSQTHAAWQDPLPRTAERAIIKPFGIRITPDDSPVEPERFSGYHTGIDYEILPGEEGTDVPVFAICGGELRLKRVADGYGGVAVQECQRDGDTVTVVYGHLRLSSIDAHVGEYLTPGESIGVLGNGFSEETDGERKHLHLAIHSGPAIELRGYVSAIDALGAWLDPGTPQQ